MLCTKSATQNVAIKYPPRSVHKAVKEQVARPSVENVAAVIVTYNPDSGFKSRVSRLIDQVACLIVVDNASCLAARQAIKGLVSPKLELIQNERNMGIAFALNQGVRRSIELGCSWTLTLDDDTTVDDNIISELSKIYERYPNKDRLGIIAANARTARSGRILANCKDRGNGFVEVKTVITSGSLISNYAYQQIGPFRDDFFIEGVDLEYCLRLRKYGYKILLSCQPVMTHISGSGEERTFLGKTVLLDNHPSWRYYYRAKNFVCLIKSYLWYEPAWFFSASVNNVKTLAKIVLFEDDMIPKFRLMCSGAYDALFKPCDFLRVKPPEDRVLKNKLYDTWPQRRPFSRQNRTALSPGTTIAAEEMACTICSNSPELLFTRLSDRLHPEVPGEFTLKQCSHCGLIFVDPQPSPEELEAHYPDIYYVNQRHARRDSAKHALIRIVARQYFGYGKPRRFLGICLFPFYFRLSHLPQWRPKGKLLDVGCGVGNRIPTFEKLGWRVEGLEMNPKAAKSARDKGCKIYVSSLEKANLPAAHFDVVYLNHVFEHLRDPHVALRKIKGTLKPNGELILVVPSANSLAFKLFKQHWFALEVPRHLFTYNRENISSVLHQHGFRVQDFAYVHTLGSITSSFAYKLGKPTDTFSVFEKPLSLVNFLIDPIFNGFGLGDWLTVHARFTANR